jgi:hypothetical protein
MKSIRSSISDRLILRPKAFFSLYPVTRKGDTRTKIEDSNSLPYVKIVYIHYIWYLKLFEPSSEDLFQGLTSLA